MVIDDTMIAFGNLHGYDNYFHCYAIFEIITPFRDRFSSINDSQTDQMRRTTLWIVQVGWPGFELVGLLLKFNISILYMYKSYRCL